MLLICQNIYFGRALIL